MNKQEIRDAAGKLVAVKDKGEIRSPSGRLWGYFDGSSTRYPSGKLAFRGDARDALAVIQSEKERGN